MDFIGNIDIIKAPEHRLYFYTLSLLYFGGAAILFGLSIFMFALSLRK